MNTYDMVRKYIEDNGFDGLVSNDYECGCDLDDLAPSECMANCEAAYKWPGNEDSPFYMRTIRYEPT